MLKKLFTLAAATAMLGANVAAHALDTARSAVKGLAGAPGEEAKPGDGTKIQPSIPPMPPMEKAQPAPGGGPDKKVAVHKTTKATKAGKATRARARLSGSTAKAAPRKTRQAARHASK